MSRQTKSDSVDLIWVSLVWSVESLSKTKRFNKRDSFCLTAKLGHDFFFPLDLNRNIIFSFILSPLGMGWNGNISFPSSHIAVFGLKLYHWYFLGSSFQLPTAGMGLVSLLNSMSQFLILNLSLYCSPSHSRISYTHAHHTHTLYICILYKLLIYMYV